jgi:hypothetical protein
MRAAANRTITITTNAGRVGRKSSTKDKSGSSKKHRSSKKHTTTEHLALPGCLDPDIAESHRRSLLQKYYNPRAMNATAPSHLASSSRTSIDSITTHTENIEDTLSEASDETLTNDTASVDTALDAHDEPTSTLNDKTLSVEGDTSSSRVSASGKQAFQAMKNYAKNLGL